MEDFTFSVQGVFISAKVTHLLNLAFICWIALTDKSEQLTARDCLFVLYLLSGLRSLRNYREQILKIQVEGERETWSKFNSDHIRLFFLGHLSRP